MATPKGPWWHMAGVHHPQKPMQFQPLLRLAPLGQLAPGKTTHPKARSRQLAGMCEPNSEEKVYQVSDAWRGRRGQNRVLRIGTC